MPFYVMRYLDGHVITQELPAGLETEAARRTLGLDLVETLVEIHAADVTQPELAAFARPGSYPERQVRRFTQLWDINKTREIYEVDEVARLLGERLPEPLPETVVHGDYRLGNMMVSPTDPTRITAVLDWEMGAIGDPRADVGYLLSTYSEPNGSTSAPRLVAGDGRARFPVASRARGALRRAERPRHRAARLVRGARALEGSGLLRGDIRPIYQGRARGRGHARGDLRARACRCLRRRHSRRSAR